MTAEEAALLSPEALFRALGTRPEGLESAEAQARLSRVGHNELPRRRGSSSIRRFAAALTHFMALLLWIAGLLAFLSGTPELGWAIWAVVFLNGVFSFWQEFRAERALAELERMLPPRARVRRDGAVALVSASDLVPGDVIELEAGDLVPADARLVSADALALDLSLLTGEAVPVARSAEAVAGRPSAATELANLVFAGTSVAAGAGCAVVYATGGDTELGRIAILTAGTQRERTTLELQVAQTVRVITTVAVAVGLAVFFASYAVFGLELHGSLLLGIAMIVANVPEGLLPTMTLAMAFGVRRMARRNALVRRLSALDSLGATSVICTDKTGTLTTHEMSLEEVWVPTGPRDESVRFALRMAHLCTNARPTGDGFVGDPTEVALLRAALRHGCEPEQPERLRELPFDPRRKRMTVVVRGRAVVDDAAPADECLAITKGAALELLDRSTHLREADRIRPLAEADRAAIRAAHDRLARQGHRVLGLAFRRGGAEILSLSEDALERDLVFAAMFALLDPPRPGVEAAIRACRQAGIQITMITGDHGATAEALARRIGLVAGPATIVTGAELEAMSDAVLETLLRSNRPLLFARVVPEHKLRIVRAYRALGAVVAVTGDGVNDAPALRAADVGVAMGRRGTDVARQAADVVLLDDDFATIVAAVEEGRAIERNIRKFMTYILSSNIPELVPFVAMVALGIPPALTIMQILAVDLGTDVFPSLALGVDPPEPGLMRRPPRPRAARLLSGRLLAHAYGFLGLLEAIAAMAAFFLVWRIHGIGLAELRALAHDLLLGVSPAEPVYRAATTATLAAIVACQVGNVFACRADDGAVVPGLRENPWLGHAILAELVLLFAFVYVPGLSDAFRTAPPPLAVLPFFFLLPPCLLTAERLRRALVRRATSRTHRRRPVPPDGRAGA